MLTDFLKSKKSKLDKKRVEGGNSNTRSQSYIQNEIWKMKISQKVKVFDWRACMNRLPTKSNLKKRKVLQDDDTYHLRSRDAKKIQLMH